MDQIVADEQRRAEMEAQHAEKTRLVALDIQTKELAKTIEILAKSSLLAAGFHRHHGEWRRQRDKTNNGNRMMTTKHTTESGNFDELEDLVRRGMAGDREVMPALRQMLDHTPELWQNVQNLVAQTEHAWLQMLANDDLVTQEILSRQLAAMKAELLASTATPLETILVETICTHWLQFQDAQLRAAKHQKQYGYMSSQHEKRLAAANKLLLGTIKSLAQVQRLLRPKSPVVNIANQQIVNMS